MLIDWTTTSAQIVNFLVLVFLLRRFLYGPVLRAMDARQERIAARLREARQKEEQADEEMRSFRRRREELDEKREEMLGEAGREADKRRRELEGKARAEVDRLKDEWHGALAREKSAFLQELRRLSGREVFRVARRALADLADHELEEHMVHVFLQRLEGMKKDEKRKMREALEGPSISVATAFEVSSGMKREIENALREIVGKGREVTFEVQSDLLAGIALRTREHVVGWNLSEYLDSLERAAREAIEEETGEGGGDS
ncbi:MAG: F0F1 ATP synthase subunit delta [Nitrospirota bacterium]